MAEGGGVPIRRAGAVVTFDEPLQVGTLDHGALDEETERRRRRVVLFLCRALVATVLAAAAPTFDPDGGRLGLALAALYVPIAAVVPRGVRGSLRWDLVAAVAADAGVLLAFGAITGHQTEVALAGLVFVALHTWSDGRAAGLAMTALAAASQVVAGQVGDVSAAPTTVVTTTAMAVLLALLVDDQGAQRSRAASGLRLVNDKAEAILAGIADAVVTTTADGRIRSVNRAAENVLGHGAAVAEGRHCAELVALRTGARALSCDGRCQLLELHGEETVEVLRTGPNGQRQPLLASATPLVAADGRVVEVVHSYRDITSVKQADEAKTLFLATASHELKTPLTVIRGFAQMLRLSGLDAEQHRQATAAIEARATQLAGIVERLLMTSRIEAGHVDLDPTLCRIDEVLAQRTRELESATNRRVERRLPDELPLVWAELDGLTTVLDHLLENAVKYSPDGGPVVVSADVDEDHVRVRCADDGVGMTEEQQARCFERFWQAEGTDVRRFGGTGIGLYIVRSLVEAMDGTIAVESAPGRGTTFTVSLRRDPPRSGPRRPGDAAPVDSDPAGASIVGEFMRQVGMPVPDRAVPEG